MSPSPETDAVATQAAPSAQVGRSYWDIVYGQFRKNRLAVWSLGVIIAIYTLSVFTPWIATDPPIYLRGTMPGIYRRMFVEYRAAHMEFVRMPADLAETQKRWRDRKVALKDFKARLTVDDWHRFGDAIDQERDKVRLEKPNDFKWKTDAVEIGAVRERLAPDKQAQLDASSERVIGELVGVYDERLNQTLRAIELKLAALALPLDSLHGEQADRASAEYRRVADAGWLQKSAEARAADQAALEDLQKSLLAAFDPDHVALEMRTYWPMPASLTTLDAALMSATFAGLVVIPLLLLLTPVGRIAPRQRKVRTCLVIILVLVAPITVWRSFQGNPFQTVTYKSAIADGSVVPEGRIVGADGAVLAEGAVVHVPIQFGMNEQDTARKFEPPSNRHWFGTDENGRDLLTRMLWGSRISLAVGFVATGIALVLGIVLGALAGFFRGWVDVVISRIIEIILCFPSLFIILAVIAVLPPSIFNVMIVLGLFGWTGIARLTRAEFLRLVDQDFVTAGRALGAGGFRLIFRHVLPNSLGPILVAASFSVASAILTESSLSFLGFGVTPPQTSWGMILSTARDDPSHYWLVLIPGFAIFLTVTLYNILGEGIRDAIDPRMRM